MNKEEIIAALSQRTGFTRRESEIALNGVLNIISDELVAGQKVQIVGFGTFEIKNRAPRMGRNPRKNLPVKIPARKVPYFTPGTVLKSAVDI